MYLIFKTCFGTKVKNSKFMHLIIWEITFS